MRSLSLLVLLALLMASCGSAPSTAPAAPKAERTEPKRNSAQPASALPTRCARRKGECLPPDRWVKRLCEGIYPDVALHLFRPETVWQRFYMLARAEPFNASGGMSLLGDKMERGEEVIALRRRRNDGEFQAGDNAGYDVLRWNGACATIHDGEFSREPPDEMRHSMIEWRRLSLEMRLALEKNPDIAVTYAAKRKACKGKSMGRVGQDCEEYDRRLVEDVVEYVRSGATLPKPGKIP